LNRPQAMALLKILGASKLIEQSWISIEKTNEDPYKLKVKSSQEASETTRFCDSNNLLIKKQRLLANFKAIIDYHFLKISEKITYKLVFQERNCMFQA
jgi:hypothetical protein